MRLPGSPVTYQRQQQTVSTPSINPNPILAGIQTASNAYQNSLAIKDDYQEQLNQAETNLATLQLSDWANEFYSNINDPASLQEYFGHTPMAEVLKGVDYDLLSTDSSYAQTIYRKGVDAAAKNITDITARGTFTTAQYLNFEQVEPTYKAAADATTQFRAKLASIDAMEAEFSTNGFTPSLLSMADNMYAQGQLGIGPEAIQSLEAIVENFGGRSQAIYISHLIEDTLQPKDENGNPVLKAKTEGEAKILVNAIQSFSEPGSKSYLSAEQIEKVKTAAISNMVSLQGAYETYKKEADQNWLDAQWARIDQIKYSEELSDSERVEYALNEQARLTALVGADRGSVETGSSVIPTVGLGIADSTKVNAMLKNLDSYISNGGADVSDQTAYNEAMSLMTNPAMDINNKLQVYREVYKPNLSREDDRYFEKRLSQDMDATIQGIKNDAYAQMKRIGASETDMIDLGIQMADYIDGVAGQQDINQTRAGVLELATNFTLERNLLDKAIAKYNTEGYDFMTSLASASMTPYDSPSFRFNDKDLNHILQLTNEGTFNGQAAHRQNMSILKPLSDAVETEFVNSVDNGNIRLNKADYTLNPNGTIATVTTLDYSGKPVIAIFPTRDKQIYDGLPEVEIYRVEPSEMEYRVTPEGQPRIKDGTFNFGGFQRSATFSYIRDDTYPNYFVGYVGPNGNLTAMPKDDQGNYVQYSGYERRVFYNEGGRVPLTVTTGELVTDEEGNQVYELTPNRILNLLTATDPYAVGR